MIYLAMQIIIGIITLVLQQKDKINYYVAMGITITTGLLTIYLNWANHEIPKIQPYSYICDYRNVAV